MISPRILLLIFGALLLIGVLVAFGFFIRKDGFPISFPAPLSSDSRLPIRGADSLVRPLLYQMSADTLLRAAKDNNLEAVIRDTWQGPYSGDFPEVLDVSDMLSQIAPMVYAYPGNEYERLLVVGRSWGDAIIEIRVMGMDLRARKNAAILEDTPFLRNSLNFLPAANAQVGPIGDYDRNAASDKRKYSRPRVWPAGTEATAGNFDLDWYRERFSVLGDINRRKLYDYRDNREIDFYVFWFKYFHATQQHELVDFDFSLHAIPDEILARAVAIAEKDGFLFSGSPGALSGYYNTSDVLFALKTSVVWTKEALSPREGCAGDSIIRFSFLAYRFEVPEVFSFVRPVYASELPSIQVIHCIDVFEGNVIYREFQDVGGREKETKVYRIEQFTPAPFVREMSGDVLTK